MERVPTTNIAGWLHTSLQGEAITDNGVPAHELLSPDQTPVAIPEEHAALYEASDIELHLVSSHHGRSFEIGPNADRSPARLGKVALWRDEYDNAYTSYSLKGNNFTYSSIMESSTAPSGYIPMGLLESDALLRVIRSSRLLREAGISTEWINRVFEPQSLIYKGEAVSQGEYKKRLLKDTANKYGLEEMMKIAKAIEPMTFFITGRSMEINDRLADFANDTPELARKRLQRIFAVYNATHADDENFRRLQPARESDRNRFFKTIFPSLLGENLAKLHNADLVHTFPTLSNVTILGGLIDLDSIRGPALNMNDEPLTAADRANDLSTITDYDHPSLEFKELYRDLSKLNIISRPWDVISAQDALVSSYSATRKPLKYKNERTIETIAISGANWLLAGEQAFRAFRELSKTEAATALDAIWDKIMKLNAVEWSPEGLSHYVRKAIDTRLLQIARGVGPNSEGTFAKETLMPPNRFVHDLKSAIDFNIRKKFQKLAEEVDAEQAFPKLKAAIPNDKTRQRALRAVAENVSWNAIQEIEELNGKEILKNIIFEAFEVEVDSLIERIKPSDWQVLAHSYDTFKVTKDVPAVDMLVYEQKAVYAFENIDYKGLIESALDSNISIMTPSVIRPFNADNYLFTPRKLIGRNAFSDGVNYELKRIYLTDVDYETVAADFNDIDQKITYFAWLCEQKNDEQPVLFVYADDVALIDQLIAEHPTTQSVHIIDGKEN